MTRRALLIFVLSVVPSMAQAQRARFRFTQVIPLTNFIDDNGVTLWTDDHGVVSFTDDLGN